MAGRKNKLDNEVFHQTFRGLLEEITKSLREKQGVIVSEAFAVVMVKVAALDPENKFLIAQPIIRSELERLKKVVIERILSMTPICRNIIRMQLHYLGNHFSKRELAKAHRAEVEDRIYPLIADIAENIPSHNSHYDDYYRKIVAAIIAKADMGDGAEYSIVRATENALVSVFPKGDIDLLTSMSREDREKEVRHLLQITAGIRIFDREIDPTLSVGIADLIKIIPENIQANLKRLAEMRERSVKRVMMYTYLVHPYFVDENAVVNKAGRRDISQGMVWVRQGLTMAHQLLLYIRQLTQELIIEDKTVDDRIKRYDRNINDLKKALNKNDTATYIVYPFYLELATAWERFQESLDFVETIEELITALDEFCENDLKQIDPQVQEALGEEFSPNEDEFFEFPMVEMPPDKFALAQYAPYTPDVDPLATEYSGFCLWSLIHGLGLVILSNPNIGVFKYHNCQYLFSTPEAATDFRRDPDVYINKAVRIIRNCPELIYLLKMDGYAFDQDYTAEADRGSSAISPLISKDAEAQTELHPIESNIVRGYTWNEWELRKQAIILSKIYKCVTHSTQTHLTEMKKTEGIQTGAIRNARVQTDTSVYSEAPRSLFWFYGLRGYHCEVPPHIVELTRDATHDSRCKCTDIRPPAKPKGPGACNRKCKEPR